MNRLLIIPMLLAVALLMGSCEREKLIELPEPVVEIRNYAGQVQLQEPNGKIELDFVAQSAAGIKLLEVLVNDNVEQRIEPSDNVFTYNHAYTYTVPATAALGDEIRVSFRMEDKAGHTVTTEPVKIRVAQPYEIVDFVSGAHSFRKLSGRVNRDLALTADQKWLIDGVVTVEQGATLTIEPGTTVYFRTFTTEAYSRLVIQRGARIVAEGTRAQPIVFTSEKTLGGVPTRSDWAGISINGRAPSNAGATVLGTDGIRYGGAEPADDSGILRFVRIEYAGKGGLHALHLHGVGSGTRVEYVQAFETYNNAFRLRGGRVSLRYIAGIQHGGYGLWADEGWQGNGQFWLFQTNIQATLIPVNYWNQARSIEFRNDASTFTKEPRTTFKLSNVTLIGNGDTGTVGDGTRRGIRIRYGSQGQFYNAIVTGFPSDAVRVEDLPLETLGSTTVIRQVHSFANRTNWEQEAKTFFFEGGGYDLHETPVDGITLTNFVGSASSALNPAQVLGSWFVNAPYAGAVSGSNDWTLGGNWFKDIHGTMRH